MNRYKFTATSLLLSGILFLLMAPAAWAVQGGCCYPDGSCVEPTRTDDCRDAGGTKPGPTETTPCSQLQCPQPEGGSCATTADCFEGMGLECVDGTCSSTKMAPAASTTGLLFLITALAIGGGVAARRRRVAS